MQLNIIASMKVSLFKCTKVAFLFHNIMYQTVSVCISGDFLQVAASICHYDWVTELFIQPSLFNNSKFVQELHVCTVIMSELLIKSFIRMIQKNVEPFNWFV